MLIHLKQKRGNVKFKINPISNGILAAEKQMSQGFIIQITNNAGLNIKRKSPFSHQSFGLQ